MLRHVHAGRSQDLYTVASSTGATGAGAAQAVAAASPTQVPVALTSFQGGMDGGGPGGQRAGKGRRAPG